MASNTENILVEFDYQNIVIVDPNKIVDGDGKTQERLVKHENLVMYANLECHIQPRSKLINGKSADDAIQVIRVADINFLNPGAKTFLDNSYTDEITGKNTVKGEGINQIRKSSVNVGNGQQRVQQILTSNGVAGPTDNGLLGITSIDITTNTSFMPLINIELEDVKGRALFEGGTNSPYAAFLFLPYPLFHLTLKGFYGKAVKFPIMLQNFQTSFDQSTGNFKISLKFFTYKYTILAELAMGYLIAAPRMYKQNLRIEQNTTNGTNSTSVKNTIVRKGYEELKKVYQIYKSKKLIPQDFPEITITEMVNRLENFIKNVLDSFSKENYDGITDYDNFKKQINDFQGDILYYQGISWAEKYLDMKNYQVDNQKIIFFTYKPGTDTQTKENSKSELQKIVDDYNEKFTKNPTVGGTIPNQIKGVSDFVYNYNSSNVDWNELYVKKKGKQPTPIDLQVFIADYEKNNLTSSVNITNSDGTQTSMVEYFFFEGANSFIEKTNQMSKNLETERTKFLDGLTQRLAQQIQTNESGIGFLPTIRNVCSVIFASGEAFLHLMDDVHDKAWNVREDKNRVGAVFNNTPNPDANLNSTISDSRIVYPWPQYLEETTTGDGNTRFEIKYPGNLVSSNQTKSYRWDIWPEVEFLENFLLASTETVEPQPSPTETDNLKQGSKFTSFDTIQYPNTDEIYGNKIDVSFIYEIYEKVFITAFYSKLNRGNSNSYSINQILAESESQNIIKSLGNDNILLSQKLKELNINASNYIQVLKQISNQGNGQSWQEFIRGIFTKTYLKSELNKSTEIFDQYEIVQPRFNPTSDVKNSQNLTSYVSDTSTNTFDLTDTYPYTDLTWLNSNMANGNNIGNEKDSFNTNKVLVYNSTKKKITNFQDSDTETQKRPILRFNYLNFETPSSTDFVSLKQFYTNRSFKPNSQVITEGEILYSNYENNVSYTQTTSMLNTPYFINSLQLGVENFKNKSKYPYREAAYLFLNSLPLSSLREKYISLDSSTENAELSGVKNELDYVFACFKKFSSLHKIPYVWILKYGSIWNRYKNWKETNVDFLSNVWKNFDYKNNFDPISGLTTTTYNLKIDGKNVDIFLEKNIPNNGSFLTKINTGFYPKVINDLCYFYESVNIFSGYTNSEIQTYIDHDLLKIVYNPDTQIIKPENFDLTNTGRTLSVTPWTVLVSANDVQYQYIIPSDGSLVNQTVQECFDETQSIMDVELSGNTSMYNGSVRMFWSLPNFGYFINENLKQPTPEEYLKKIFETNGTEQSNFRLSGLGEKYTDISEIFSVFEKEVLDLMENEFLNYSKPASEFEYKSNGVKLNELIISELKPLIVTNCDTNTKEYSAGTENIILSIANKYNKPLNEVKQLGLDGITQKVENIPDSTVNIRNFQLFMRDSMKIPKFSGNTSTSGKTGTSLNIGISLITNSQKQINQKFVSNLKSLMVYDVYLKYGNPSKFDKRLFYTFSTIPFDYPYDYKPYVQNTLPTNGGTVTLLDSKQKKPDVWKDLELYIGFSNIQELVYKDNGSYITDFFVDLNIEFTSTNIKNFAPIIKIYATQKLINPNITKTEFIDLVTKYIQDQQSFDDDIINSCMLLVRNGINITEEPISNKDSAIIGSQIKDELWETFKALNDKWIAGTDFDNKTLFEDVLFLDRASRDLGDKVIVDIFKLKSLLKDVNPSLDMQSVVNTIIEQNNFVIFNTPSYCNFYNVQDVSSQKVSTEGSLEFANTLFGTFTEVDYRQTGPKIVCLFGGIPSKTVAMDDNVDFNYTSDAFNLERASNNPLLENQQNKTNWDRSNKVVGFNVDFGVQNQQVFNGFTLAQENGKATAESLEILNRMAQQGGGRTTATQNISLYDLYKNRSYSCSISMLGNALIQPTMYFNLRYIPMFNGPYMITEVKHSISPGQFNTVFSGVRQPVYDVAKLDDFIQSIKTNLVNQIIEEVKIQKQSQQQTNSQNVNQQKQNVENTTKKDVLPTANTTAPIPNQTQTTTTNQTATQTNNTAVTNTSSEKLASIYKSTYKEITPNQTTINFRDMGKLIVDTITANNYPNPEKLKYLVFATMYLGSGDKTKGFISWENNYSKVNLTETDGNWGKNVSCDGNVQGGSLAYFPKREYFSLEPGIPYAVFNSVDDNVKMILARWYNRAIPNVDAKEITKFWILNFTSKMREENVYTTYDPTQLSNLENQVQESISVFNSLNT